MGPVRVARAFRLQILAAVSTLGLAGCVHTTSPVAVAQPPNDLDAMAYGQPSNAAPAGVVVAQAARDSGGAIGVSKMISNGRGRIFGGALKMPS